MERVELDGENGHTTDALRNISSSFRGQLRKCKARKEESLALAGEETAKRGGKGTNIIFSTANHQVVDGIVGWSLPEEPDVEEWCIFGKMVAEMFVVSIPMRIVGGFEKKISCDN